MQEDPVEKTKEYKAVIKEVEAKIEKMIGEHRGIMGYCHMYWPMKKKLLKNRGIEWKSPAELNPDTLFD